MLETIRKTAEWVIALGLLGIALCCASKAQAQTLPTKTTDNDMILVSIKINGADYRMLLDTGAEHTIIGEAGVGKQKGKDTSQGLTFEATARLVTIQIADTPAFKTHVLSANLDGFKKRFNGERVDGILGQDILRRFSSIRLNYKTNQLELE